MQHERQQLPVFSAIILIFTLGILGCQGQNQNFKLVEGEMVSEAEFDSIIDEHGEDHETHYDDAGEMNSIIMMGCKKPSSVQLSPVKLGNTKYEKFLKKCKAATSSSKWCSQLTRPNPSSKSTFYCTYSDEMPHRFIHPDESTWKFAFTAVQLIQELEAKGVSVAQIYNWWRPEPYNKNVGGAAGRHPYGTSVDVRFSSMRDMTKAHSQLCKWRKQGRLRALGYYGSTGLHFGIGDHAANTWGKSCP